MINQKSHSLLKHTMVAGMTMALAKIIGFVREIVLAAFYGTEATSDAFILAYTIPDVLLYFIGVSIASSFITLYHRVKDKTKFTRSIMTCLLLAGLLISAILTMAPGALVKLFAFRLSPKTFDLAVYFVRYMVWSAIFILLTGVCNAYLEIKGDFFAAGMRSIWRNALIILGIVLGALTGHNLIIALAPIAGNALCAFLLLAGCHKQGYTYRPYIDVKSPELKQMLLLAGPMLVSAAVTEINQIIDRNFAAALPAGSISSLNYSGKVQALFVALIGQSLFTVLFPYMSKLAASGDILKLKDTLIRGIMNIVIIMTPFCVGVIILAEPGIRVLFQRGSFTAADTAQTASSLRMYALAMVPLSINPLLMRAFYAVQNTKVPRNVSVVTVMLNITLNYFFIWLLGAEGLALSSSLSGTLSMALLLFCLRKEMGYLGLRRNLPEFLKIAFASAIAGICMAFLAGALPLMSVPVLQSILLCVLPLAVSSFIYIALLLLLRSKIAFSITIKAIKLCEKKRKLCEKKRKFIS